MTDKLIVFGQVKRKLTGLFTPIHFIYEYEEGRAAVQSLEEVVDIVEPYSSICNWGKLRDTVVTEK